MINLKEVLHSFSDEKQQDFIIYLNKKNKRKDSKDSQLVSLLLSDNLSSKEVSEKLYGIQNKVALHALRKRLFQSLINFTANISMKEENSIDVKLIKYLLSARNFLQKGHIKIGYQILYKAEVIANQHQLFSILNEIYHTKIQYSHSNQHISFDKIIFDFNENQQQLLLEDNLNIVYARIKKSLVEFQHKKSTINIKLLIENILKEQNIVISDSFSFKSLYQIIQITNISSAQNFDYWNIEQFIIETYQLIKNHKSKEKQSYYHIEVLYITANALFRSKKFKQSQEYLQLMFFYMNENKQKYYNNYSVKYHLLLALNYNYTNKQDEGIKILETYIEKRNINIISQLDIYLALTVFYFHNNSLEKAKNSISKFYHTDKWYIDKAGIIFTIKKSLIEILLQIDLGNIDLVDSRLNSFKRNYFNHLKNINQEKVITYLKLVETYYKTPEVVTSTTFNEKVENSFHWIDREKEDIFMMSFFAWLKAKMTKTDVYLVTLDLINR
ncbi:hypothetical protein [Polaribacter sp.]|uniref:hypothetical protein n=1 Tax=Polaribacter sp. TaxID=1920175 RepID=UPI003EF531A7